MDKKSVNNVRLGVFVLSAVAFLIFLLYMIGRNKSLFGATYILNAKFENVQGLIPGNNVRYLGIQTGTVKGIEIVNDTTIVVSMLIEKNMQQIIRKNATAAIGTDGIVGNKVINIVPNKTYAELATDGDIIYSKKPMNTDEILSTLSKTNQDVAVIAAELKITVQQINNSKGLWALMNDQKLAEELQQSAINLNFATAKAGLLANNLNYIVKDVAGGKGTVGMLLKDTAFAYQLHEAAFKINKVGTRIDSLTLAIDKIVKGVDKDINDGKGPANAFLKDSVLVKNLSLTIENLRKGTHSFNQNMDAIKSSFLFRGYFKRQERQNQLENSQK